MPITIGDIVDALTALGGEAHYTDITAHILETATPPFPADPAASVRARLQERCSDYLAYLGQADMFDSEKDSGVWRFRTWKPAEPSAPGQVDDADADYEASEGGLQMRTHLARERNPALVRKFKASLPDPRCEACDMRFAEVYGELAADYIEAHHRIPIAASDADRRTTLADLAALCANCHRVIHRNYPMSVEELAAILSKPDGFTSDMKEVRMTRANWQTAVEAAIRRIVTKHGSDEFSRQTLIDEELDAIVAAVEAKGATPAQTLSRVLQELRDADVIAFTGDDGLYRLN